MLDLAIRGGMVAAPAGSAQLDIGVKGKTIVEVASPGYLATDPQAEIDATGMIVVPGGIDPHVHCDWPLMHVVDGQEVFSAPPSEVSRAAPLRGNDHPDRLRRLGARRDADGDHGSIRGEVAR